MKTKGVAGLWGAVIAWLGSPLPESVVVSAYLLIAFVCVDTLAGLYLAGLQGRISSRRLYQMMITKLVQYTILIVIGGGGALVLRNWALVTMCFGALVGAETLSLMETAVGLEQFGVSLRYMKPFLAAAKKVLAAGSMTEEKVEKPENSGGSGNLPPSGGATA